jgi:hypothetical protein
MYTSAIARLALLARRAAAEQPDLLAAIATAVNAALAGDADPYSVTRTLLDGMAQTLATLPQQRRSDTIRMAIRVLLDRLDAEDAS